MDSAGNKSITAFVIGSIDKTKPTLAFSPSTVSIRQNSDVQDLIDLLNCGCTARDNKSDSAVIGVTYDDSGIDLTEVGLYMVTYTAKDEAGNLGTATR